MKKVKKGIGEKARKKGKRGRIYLRALKGADSDLR
jgi:hypothetical protein